MDPLDDFLNQLNQCINSSPEEVSILLNPNVRVNQHLVRLNGLNINQKSLQSIIDSKHFFDDEWLAFNELVISFVSLARDLDPWSSLASFDLFTTFLNDLSIAFSNNNRGHYLTLLVRSSIDIILPMAIQLDFQLYHKEDCLQPRLSYLASLFLKMFNNIRSQSLISNNKKTIILLLGNKLCNVYFKLGNPLLCQNIFSNMNNANLNFNSFTVNEQIQYRYYLARFYLIKNSLANSYIHLNWCLQQITNSSTNQNIDIILKYLIPVSILMGKRPNFTYIAHTYYQSKNLQIPSFIFHYQKIQQAIKLGNYNLFIDCFNEPSIKQELIKNGLYILIGQKSIVLLIRNLIKKVWILLGKPSRISYHQIHIALQLSISSKYQNSGYDMFSFLQLPIQDSTIENLLITLISQTLMKGKLSSNQQSVALAKMNVFPPVDSVYFVLFGNGSESNLNHNDKWMMSSN